MVEIDKSISLLLNRLILLYKKSKVMQEPNFIAIDEWDVDIRIEEDMTREPKITELVFNSVT